MLKGTITALVLATMMPPGVLHAGSRSVPPVTRATSDGVPAYDIEAACREMASIPEARLFESSGLEASKRCVNDEKSAREQLLERWAKFKAADRIMCGGASRSGTVSPTYTELITCLEMTRDNYGSETTELRRGAQPEQQRSAAAGASASSLQPSRGRSLYRSQPKARNRVRLGRQLLTNPLRHQARRQMIRALQSQN